MMHRNFPTTTIVNDPPIDSTKLGPSLYSPFSYSLSVGEPNMIKQAAPQHPHGLTKLQHRLLYESDSESSFDLSFSSPSSIGSASEYSDVGYQSSTKSRSRTSGLSRHAPTHSSGSRSGSISSVLGSSMAIQRVLMGSTQPSRSTAQSQRQSVRSIASAFEAAGRTGTMRAPPKLGSQLGPVQEQSVSGSQASRPSALESASASTLSDRPVASSTTIPARLKISKQPIKGPSSAPVVSEASHRSSSHSISRTHDEPTSTEPHFVFPPRTPLQHRYPYNQPDARIHSFISLDGHDENEPAFDIVPSPSRKRSSPSPPSAVEPAQHAHNTPRASLSRSPSTFDSDPLSSSRSAASRDSMDSSYSLDSLSGHPFSLQLPGEGEDEFDLPASSAASIHAGELDAFRSALIGLGGDDGFISPPSAPAGGKLEHAGQRIQPITAKSQVTCTRAAASLQPLLLSTSRPTSSSSTTTVQPVEPATDSMRLNEDTSFPMPPSTVGSAKRSIRSAVEGFANKIGAQPSSTQEKDAVELKRQAAELLESIRSLGDEIDSSIPPTHRLPGSAYKAWPLSSSDSINTSSSGATTTTSFVAVDESYSDVWRLMDQWYWSSFEVGPKQSLD